MIALPRPLVSVLKSAGPLHRLSRGLQLGRCRRILDHLLVHAAFPYVLSVDTSLNKTLSRVSWDYDALMMSLRRGSQR
eukprot:2805750-Pyramimonas_sp.AAC.1